jgi:CHAD domain-containing protein
MQAGAATSGGHEAAARPSDDPGEQPPVGQPPDERPPDEQGRPAGAGSAAAAVRDYLLEQVSALHWAVADGDVHDARVACRRARSVLLAHVDLFVPVRQRAVRRVAGRARDLGRELSGARDEEVLEEVVRGWAAEQSWPRERVDDALRLLAPAGASDGAVDRAREGLLALADEVADLASSPLWGGAAAEAVVPGLAPTRAQEAGRLVRRVRAARDAGADPASDERWHDVRKAAKRLRYTAEVAHRSGDLAAGDQAVAARRLQTALGDLQDLQRVRTRVDEVSAGEVAGPDAVVLRELGEQVDRASATARRDVEQALAETLGAVVGGSSSPIAPAPEDPS